MHSPSGGGGLIPPGSKNGACAYGGNSGTWESQLFLCSREPEEEGDRRDKSPGVGGEFSPRLANRKRATNYRQRAEYRGTSDERSIPRWALAVLAEHSTDG